MSKHSLGKRILTDALGILLIVSAPVVGLLPGPGGIPMIIAGLGLLAINEPWARRMLHYVRKHSESFRDVVFPDNRYIQWLWDLGALLLIVVGTVINIYVSSRLLRAFSLPLFTVATIIFLFNRHRLHWLENKINKLKK